MADFPLFVATEASWKPGLVLVTAKDASGVSQTVLPDFEVAEVQGQRGVKIHSLPGLAPSTKYTLTVLVLPE